MEPDASAIVILKILILRQVVEREGEHFSLACLASTDGLVLRILHCRIVLVAMKVEELKQELEARDEVKMWLRRRLYAAIVRKHLESTD